MSGELRTNRTQRRHLCLDCAWHSDTDWETMTTLCTRTETRNERGRIVTGCSLFKRRLKAKRRELRP